jgi:hypothetical protein
MSKRTGNGRSSFRNSRRTSVLPNPGITLGTIPLAPPLAQSPQAAPMVDDAGSPNLNAELPSSLTPEALQPLIKETLRQLGIQRTEQSGSQSSGPRRSTASTPTHKVKEQQRLMSKDVDRDWKVSREIFLSFLSHFIYRLRSVTSGDNRMDGQQQAISMTTSPFLKLESKLLKMALPYLRPSSMILISVKGMNDHAGMSLFLNSSAEIFLKHVQLRGAGTFQMFLRITCWAYSMDI